MEERRLIPRWQIGREARVSVGQVLFFDDCYVEDMNLKGLRISLARPLPVRPLVEMALDLSDTCQVEVEVRIPWRRVENGRHVYGLAFNRIKDADRDRIFQFLSSNCPRQFKEHWWAGTKAVNEGR